MTKQLVELLADELLQLCSEPAGQCETPPLCDLAMCFCNTAYSSHSPYSQPCTFILSKENIQVAGLAWHVENGWLFPAPYYSSEFAQHITYNSRLMAGQSQACNKMQDCRGYYMNDM